MSILPTPPIPGIRCPPKTQRYGENPAPGPGCFYGDTDAVFKPGENGKELCTNKTLVDVDAAVDTDTGVYPPPPRPSDSWAGS